MSSKFRHHAVAFDPTQVEQVLINLLRNARESGSDSVVFGAECSAHGGRIGIANREGGGVVVELWLPPQRAPQN